MQTFCFLLKSHGFVSDSEVVEAEFLNCYFVFILQKVLPYQNKQ